MLDVFIYTLSGCGGGCIYEAQGFGRSCWANSEGKVSLWRDGCREGEVTCPSFVPALLSTDELMGLQLAQM